MEEIALRRKPRKNRRDLIFYILFIAFPVLQFCIFYIYVNINSIILAFKTYSTLDGGYTGFSFANFTKLFSDFSKTNTLRKALGNSILVWGLSTIVSLPLAMLFSYFIYNKRQGSKIFKVLLFLPSIIPSIATTIIYLYFVEKAVPALMVSLFKKEIIGLLQDKSTRFGAVFFYNIFISFGGNVILLLGGMNSINPSVREAAWIDGAEGIKEFFHIILPSIWPTLTTFFVMGLAGLFTSQFSLYNFFGIAASEDLATMGYLLYSKTSIASIADYPSLAATGILLTVIIIPVVLVAKKLLEKFGPSEA